MHYRVVRCCGMVMAILACYCFNILAQSSSESNKSRKIKEFGSSVKEFGKPKKDDKDDKNSDLTDDDTIRIKTSLVVSDVLVVNQKGNLVVGLKKSDFILTEDGKKQEIGMFSFGGNSTIPRSIVLIIENGGTPSFVEHSIEAAKKLVDKLSPQDEMAIATDNLKLLSDFTKDKNLLKSRLNELVKKKGPSLREFSTLLAVLNEIFDNRQLYQIVIFQSSGDESVLLKPIWESHHKFCLSGVTDFCERGFSFNDVTKAIEKSRATIYSVIPQPRVIGLPRSEQIEKVGILLEAMSREIHRRKDQKAINKFVKEWEEFTLKECLAIQTSMFEVANLSGGYTDYIEKPEDAESVYSTLFTTISNRYVIGYYPTERENDRRNRTIKIEVKDHPEYKILGRKTYTVEY